MLTVLVDHTIPCANVKGKLLKYIVVCFDHLGLDHWPQKAIQSRTERVNCMLHLAEALLSTPLHFRLDQCFLHLYK